MTHAAELVRQHGEGRKAVTADWVELRLPCQNSHHGYKGCLNFLAEEELFNSINIIQNHGNQTFAC